MTKRRLCRWSLILVTLAVLAVWLEPSRVVWGWLRGEVFFQGRPTSFWRSVIQRDLQTDPRLLESRMFAAPPPPTATWWERTIEWLNLHTNRLTSRELLTWDKSSRGVLQALAEDADAKVAAFAKDAMHYRLWASPHGYWLDLMRKLT